MLMTSGWGLQQRLTSPITKIQYTKNKNCQWSSARVKDFKPPGRSVIL